MDLAVEIRKLPMSATLQLCHILDIADSWKELMAIIPIDPRDLDSSLKYTVEHIVMVKNTALRDKRSYTEVLLEEWSTSGRVRPTLKTLLDLLNRAMLYRAADYISTLLGQSSTPFKLTPTSNELPLVPFSVLKAVTHDFDDTPLVKYEELGEVRYVGCKVGSGAFGAVYFARTDDEVMVAVKRLKDTTNQVQQFNNEIQMLSLYQHVNLLPLLGYSVDESEYCLIYKYMANGSLYDRLYNNKTDLPLQWRDRLKIGLGSCRGIEYLHTSRPQPLIHRDIKTANILLDHDLTPKIGDFGLVKFNKNANSTVLTSNVLGTSQYMAPEYFRGDLSPKIDVFSMGVVFLELITGLPPFDEEREHHDLVTYIENTVESDVTPYVDVDAAWDGCVVRQFFDLAKQCLNEKKKRPAMDEVVRDLEPMYMTSLA